MTRRSFFSILAAPFIAASAAAALPRPTPRGFIAHYREPIRSVHPAWKLGTLVNPHVIPLDHHNGGVSVTVIDGRYWIATREGWEPPRVRWSGLASPPPDVVESIFPRRSQR